MCCVLTHSVAVPNVLFYVFYRRKIEANSTLDPQTVCLSMSSMFVLTNMKISV